MCFILARAEKRGYFDIQRRVLAQVYARLEGAAGDKGMGCRHGFWRRRAIGARISTGRQQHTPRHSLAEGRAPDCEEDDAAGDEAR